jgi:CHASE3 domain sensor protein
MEKFKILLVCAYALSFLFVIVIAFYLIIQAMNRNYKIKKERIRNELKTRLDHEDLEDCLQNLGLNEKDN